MVKNTPTTRLATDSITTGGKAIAEIGHPGDVDWFAVTLEAGQTYRIDLQGASSGVGTLLDPYLQAIYDADGNPISGMTDDDSGAGLDSQLTFTVETSGTYYIAASAWNSSTGTYNLSVTNVTGSAQDDFGASSGTAGTVTVGDSTTGNISHAGDNDWFAVTLEAGKTYRIDLQGVSSGAGTLRDPSLQGIYDADGKLISGTSNDDSGAGRDSQLTFTAQADGTYYVSAGAWSNFTGTYKVSVTDISDGSSDDYGATAETTGTVAVDGSTSGEIGHADDVDWFAVTLEAGKTYRIDLKGASSGSGTLHDPYLKAYDADGNQVSGMADDDSGAGLDSQLTFTVETSGTYYISASTRYDDTGTYNLSVTNVTGSAQDDYGASIETAGTIEVGGSTTGNIGHTGDVDVFAVTLEAGKTYRIDLQGVSSGAGTLRDPKLQGIYDSGGQVISGTSNDDGGAGRDSQLTFTAQADGTYYVAAEGWHHYTGTYKVSVTRISDSSSDEYGTTAETAGTVAVDGSTSGEIGHPGDVDWIAVTLEAGKTYRIDLKGGSSGSGTLHDPYLKAIYDADGNPVSGMTDDDSGAGLDSQLTFTVETSGTYYMAASARNGKTGTYNLSVTNVTGSAQDDYGASSGTAGTIEVGGSTTGNIGHTGDIDWFTVTLEEGKTYRIDLQGASSGAGTLRDPKLQGIYDADGHLISGTSNDDGGAGKDSQLTFTAQADGTYYVSAYAWSKFTGTYKVSVTDISDSSSDEYGITAETAGTVAVDDSTSGEIGHPGDVDWIAVTLEAGKSYRIDLKGGSSGSGTLHDPYLKAIYDAEGNSVSGMADDDSGAGLDSQLTFTVETSGTYYIAASARNGNTGTYNLSVTNVTGSTQDDYGASIETAGTIEVGGSTTGNIGHTGDVDLFAVTLEAGKTYRIDLQGVSSGAGTLRDPKLQGIYDADGHVISGTSNDDGGAGRDSQLTFTAQADGKYYVAAKGFHNYTGTYRVSVTDISDSSSDDYGTTVETAGTIEVGGSTSGEIGHAGDFDWFAVVLEADKAYRIDLRGASSDSGTLGNPNLQDIYGADGTSIFGATKKSGQTGYGDQLTFTTQTSGTFYIEAGAWKSSTGTYEVSIAEAANSGGGSPTTGNLLVGGAGNDTLVGGVGDDVLQGDEGNDTLRGRRGDDRLEGGSGNDTLIGGVGDDMLDGGSGDDMLLGSAGNDTLRGRRGDDTLYGGDGHDTLYGGAGDDMLDGGSGDDVLRGNKGNDTLHGRRGDDTLYGGAGDDTLIGGVGDDTLYGGAGHDLLDGGWGDDVLLGNEGNDTLRGRYGDDRLEGGSGHDTLIGGAGDDVLDGGLGNDWLAGGIGDDVLRGSGGSDKFVFSGLFGTDTIKDFTDDDLIDLSALSMSFNEVMENARQDGSDVRLELESGTIVLENFELADLDYTDFLF